VTLTAADVAEIMRLVEESSFNELTLEVEGLKLNLKRGNSAGTPDSSHASVVHAGSATPAGSSAHASSSTPRAPASPAAGSQGAPSTHSAPVAPVPVDPNSHAVAAPLLGTFYRAPKPGAPPFVEVGSKVEEETVIGIIEVMKLMNTVRAGVRGTVTEILARDGVLVEYGETLMRVGKQG
jgi:acetyl-CoA carboxylase biotin carboxyl carrier protein